MSYIVIGNPGSESGPCADVLCGHEDCRWMSQIVRADCPYCSKAIGYGNQIIHAWRLDLETPVKFELSFDRYWVHYVCHAEAIEKAQKEV
jgi:hypothetical protein